MEIVLLEFGLEITDKIPVSFRCDCGRERVEKVLLSLGRKDLRELIDEGKEVELHCHFCNKRYAFSVEEIENLVKAQGDING